MNALRIPKSTVAEYLAIERRAEFKSEFLNGEMFAMAGASRMHNRLAMNLAIQIGQRLVPGPCYIVGSDQRVKVTATGLITYPDLVLQCEPPEVDPLDRETLTNPTVLIEILSPSTEKYDRGEKFKHYKRIASLKEYILVSQTGVTVERFIRSDGPFWLYDTATELDEELALDSVGIRLPLAEIYRGIDFDTEPETGGSP